MNFHKYYVLDTNILLEDATNIYKLSQEGKNLIRFGRTFRRIAAWKKIGIIFTL